jgi:alpha-glucuronidase
MNILKLLKELYNEKGLNANDVLNTIYEQLFTGTSCFLNVNNFQKNRQQIIDLINLIKMMRNIVMNEIDIQKDSADITLRR